MRKSVGQAPTAERANKRKKKVSDRLLQRSGRANAKKKCRTSPDIGAERENRNVGRGLT